MDSCNAMSLCARACSAAVAIPSCVYSLLFSGLGFVMCGFTLFQLVLPPPLFPPLFSYWLCYLFYEPSSILDEFPSLQREEHVFVNM
ncbi:hypothetical protein BDZ91DRAFT_731280 [Kalaharituber pfeilii]|nr:hypothetical protein BDZ91DRAFT_731280 [Kalaharituber pfeilii]